MKSPFGIVVSVVFIAYIAHTMYTFYGLFFPKQCVSNQPHKCIKPYLLRNKKLEMAVYTSLKKVHLDERDLTLVWMYDNFTISSKAERTFKVSIPRPTRKNGTLYVHVFVYPRNEDVFVTKYASHVLAKLTEYAIPQSETFSLLNSDGKNNSGKDYTQRIAHWRSKLTLNVLHDDISFDRYALPGEIYKLIKPSPEGDYLPIVFIDELGFRTKDLVAINTSIRHLPLSITYSPISIGKLRLWAMMIESMTTLRNLGFTEKDTDEIKGIFVDTNFYFLMLTFLVAAFHLLFDFLAFKNDITFWKNRNSMEGLSIRVVSWRCISTIIIFLYLMDESTSLLVLIPAGIGAIIEVWKVKKAFKMKLVWHGIKPTIEWGEATDKEKETERFDSQAMKYLSYILYPLCLGGAVYSLLYTQHKSWYSWVIQSMVNGVYAFGFLFMLPQLFLNYKLKSVAHLPWRAFMYKAFNTFIDDVFAFIITMPTAHRLACFRDDLVFIIYLYQRWLYPVDRSRVNEYGVSYEDEKSDDKSNMIKDGVSTNDIKSSKAKKID